ncbi:SDR family oxidoreductase [Haematospirillum sp. H1815]|uniref:SDR family NAD(P)-dependent oxidoreductase n=1 Tax=Haematospirillum sp. H1815 TaxID=2723108 RepID=UPI00143BD16F|nr:SDR family oxidoreductase [Haematospirillum sp. H1815]NKD77969.1 SDR family oxidoreductase [Haematospirillum sp. H1815]
MSSVFTLNNKTILITGSSSGIGRVTAIECAKSGASIVASGRNEEKLEELVSLLPGDGHMWLAADLTDDAQSLALAESVGTIDGIVHSAGVSKLMPFRWMSDAFFDEITHINLRAPVLLSRNLMAAGKIRSGGSVLFMSSIAGLTGAVGLAAYAGAKNGLLAVARVMAKESMKKRIRVNVLIPSLVSTPMTLEGDKVSQVALERAAEKYPWGFAEPEDIAYACIYFLSDASRWVTGTSLVIDGGAMLSMG